jgi:hypothetical protein
LAFFRSFAASVSRLGVFQKFLQKTSRSYVLGVQERCWRILEQAWKLVEFLGVLLGRSGVLSEALGRLLGVLAALL